MTSAWAAWVGAGARWLSFLALFVALGGCVFRFGVARALRGRPELDLDRVHDRAARWGQRAGAALVVALLLKLAAQLLSFAEPGEPLTAGFALTVVKDTAWGHGWLTQLVAAGLVLGGFGAARRLRRPGWMMAVVGVTALVLAVPLTGHAVAAERAGGWGYALDVIHLLGGGSWLGTLAVVLLAGLPATPAEERGAVERAALLVNAFSPIALASAALALGAGSVLAFRYLDGSLAALVSTGYGRTLLIKLAVLLGAGGVGTYNWRVLRPRLGAAAGPRQVRRSGFLELALGGLLLAATAVLVALPMPGEE